MSVCGPFVNMKLLVELFPNMNSISVYRWNSTAAKTKRLPEPDAVLSGGVRLWTVDTIMDWSDRCGMGLERDVVETAAAAQFVSPVGLNSPHE